MEKGWNGLPYRPISQFYQNYFGEKVYKIPLAIADDCPNRRGLKGMQTCIFCDEWGSAARSEAMHMEVRAQIIKYHELLRQKRKAKAFLAYFQAYTSTFLKLKTLQENLNTALSFDFIKGVVVGTRPDCLSAAVLDTWKSLANKSYVSIELGVQSFQDQQLSFLRRGHSAADSLQCIERIHSFGQGKLHLGIHLIFGLPGETDEDIIEAARTCNQLPILNVKLHHLHVLKNTPLAELYERGDFAPLDFLTYARRVSLFLQHLSPRIYVDRLAAYSSRWNELVAPAWTADKMQSHQGIIDFMRAEKHYQSRLYQTTNSQDIDLKSALARQASPSDLRI
jgi:uncharacterized protein